MKIKIHCWERIRIETIEFISLLIWILFYTVAVNRLLPETYNIWATPIAYYGKDFSYLRFLVSVLVIAASFIITKRLRTQNIVLYYIKNILFVVFYVPAVLSFALLHYYYSEQFLIYCILYWFMFCCFSQCLSFNIKRCRLKTGKSISGIDLWLVFTTLLVIYVVCQNGGVNLSLSVLSGVYEQRAAYKENATLLSVVIKSVLGYFVCPIMVAANLDKRKIAKAVVFVFFQIIVFSLARDKVYLMILAVAIIIGVASWVIDVERVENLGIIVFNGLSILCFMALNGVFEDILFSAIVRRLFLMPVWLQYINFHYFYNLEKIWWRQDTFLIDKLFTPVYERSLVKIIAQDWFDADFNPNCGMVAEAFTRCGFLGIIIYPVLLVTLLTAINSCVKDENNIVILILCIALGLIISNDVISSTTFVLMMIFICCSFKLLKVPDKQGRSGIG